MPPDTPAKAARRIALGLTALFMLSPATRFGYFIYPLALYGWAALSAPGRPVTWRPDAFPKPRQPCPPAAVSEELVH